MIDTPCNQPSFADTPGSEAVILGQPLPLARVEGHWPIAAYIHIPFCRRRCFYCDFPISVVGDRKRGETSLAIADYVDLLCQEIAVTPVGSDPLATVFLGGGTPSLLSSPQLHQIIQTLQQRFGLDPTAEVSIEMDPGTFTLEQIKAYQQGGINRVSLGVQAFQDELLQACGRSHTVAEIYAAIAILQQAEITNFSLDLISGLPHQTQPHWQTSLDAALQINPPHLSIYDLVLEPTTVFGKHYQAGSQPLPCDETTAQMYCLASDRLQAAGYNHYEISNYARPGYQCRHNRVYWQNQPYYGFGMGATSYLKRQRYSRPRTQVAYRQWVQALIAANGQITCAISTPIDILLETLMLGLRLSSGLALTHLNQTFGAVMTEQIIASLVPYQQQGWVAIDAAKNGNLYIRLTDPQGFLFSNTVLATLWETLGDLENL